ncbi:MAG TPA: amidohydrolase [Candidatus Limnocylindrales bacterium]|nr:amidohydrolase [Candidatus Limnocylindrales bacterium]
MSKHLIRGAIIIPIDPERPDYFVGDILVHDGMIETVSAYPLELDPMQADQITAGEKLIVMPGFVNTHGHAAMTLFRSYADDIPLKDWLEKKIWPIEARLESDDIYWGTMLAIVEMLKGGTTTFTDMYFFMDRVAQAAAQSGIRAVLSRGLIGFGGRSEEGLRETEALIENWHGAEAGRINIILGPHALYTCPPDFLHLVMDLAGRTERPIQIHLAETAGEVEDCLKIHGCTPAKLLYDLGLFDYRVIAAHCVHLSDEDIHLLAEKRVGVAHNPGSNLKLGSGIAPLVKMLQAGIKVGLGTDGASSNNNLDMLEEMRLATLLAKGTYHDPTMVGARTALELATRRGAQVLDLNRVGSIKEGYKADLIGINRDVPHMTPLHDPLAHVVYAAAAADVRLVMVDGTVLIEKGEFKLLDEEKIMAEASRCAARLTGGGRL